MLKSFYPLLGLCFILSICGCKEENTCEQAGTIRNFQGQDGCGFIIEGGSGEYFEPINFQQFGVVLIDGQAVNFSYIVPAVQPTCLIATPIELTCFVEQ